MKKEIAPWVANRIVHFFNTVQKPAEIVEGIMDDPGDQENTAFRQSLARRILKVRESLPLQRFTDLAQIDAIQGVGPDKMEDLAYTFGVGASEAFENALFENGLLMENWTLLRYEWEAEDEAAYRAIIDNPEAFRETVHNLAMRAAMETAGHSETEAKSLTNSLRTDYIDAYHNSTEEAAYAFALWFYRFDADNWFSHKAMFEQTNALFNYHSDPFTNMELRLFKGFDNNILLSLITNLDLPVTVNDAERIITIWVVGLAD
jgi:hypothetical protein